MAMTTVYLAATTSRRAELRLYRTALEALGYEVTSRWLDRVFPDNYAERLNDAPWEFTEWALEDANDVARARILISFTGGGSLGGRHVEFGIALEASRRLVLCGPREHLFHTGPRVEVYPDWPAVLTSMPNAGNYE